jgi:protein-tyrosine phosphatase
MSQRRTWVRRLLVVGLVVLAGEQLWRHGRDYVFADQFETVEPGRLYRGAWQQPWPMRRIARNYKIKTIVALAHPPDHPLAIREAKLARELGCRWVHIPIVEEWGPGHTTVADALERAADVLADPANQPVFFHCHHGLNRASLVQMAYRMLHCGWTLDQAEAEIKDSIGLVAVHQGVDYRYMPTFYRERVLPRRAAGAVAASAPRR